MYLTVMSTYRRMERALTVLIQAIRRTLALGQKMKIKKNGKSKGIRRKKRKRKWQRRLQLIKHPRYLGSAQMKSATAWGRNALIRQSGRSGRHEAESHIGTMCTKTKLWSTPGLQSGQNRESQNERYYFTRRYKRPDRGHLDDPVRWPGTGSRRHDPVLDDLLGAGGVDRSKRKEGSTWK